MCCMTLSRLLNSLEFSSLTDKMKRILLLEGLNELTYRHNLILLYFALPCFIDIALFLQIESLRQPCVEKLIGDVFPTAFTHSLSLRHILVILAIFQTLSLLLYL